MASPESSDTILTLPNNITVRQYRLSDIPALAKHGNNKAIWNNLRNRMPHPYTLEDSESWVKLCLGSSLWVGTGAYTPNPDGAPGGTSAGEPVPTKYAICIRDEAVGAISFDFNDPEDIYARNAEIGYWLSVSYWGKGIMGVVVPAFVEWGWRTFGRLLRMNAEVKEGNLGSRRCLEKAGFVVEGRRRFGFVKNGILENNLMLGMLRPGMDEAGVVDEKK